MKKIMGLVLYFPLCQVFRKTNCQLTPHFQEAYWLHLWKCPPVQALRLCTGRTAHRGSRGIALPFRDHGTKEAEWSASRPGPLFTPREDPVPIVKEAGWAPGPVWTGAETLAPPGFDPRTVQPVASRYTDYATRPTDSIFSATEFHSGIHSHLRRKQLCYKHWLFWAYLPIGLEQDLFPLPFLSFC